LTTNPNIASKPSIVTRAAEVIWLPAWKERSGTVIKTTDDKLPILPLMEPVAVAVYHIHKFKQYTDAQFKAEIDAINSGGWRGWGAAQAWISKIFSEGQDQYGESTGELVHYVIRCIDRPDGWKMLYPDVSYLDPEPDVPVTILDKKTKKEIDFNSISGLV
jgi:hypothetical protein